MRRTHLHAHRLLLAVLPVVLAAGACSGDDDASPPTSASPVTDATSTTSPATTGPATTARATDAPAVTAAPTAAAPTSAAATTVPAGPAGADARAMVAALAADEMGGRDDGTAGSLAAQEYLAGQLAEFAEPAFPDREGFEAYVQPGPSGNVVGIVRGAELPDEYVVLGAHYDGLGSDCHQLEPDDTVCNAATDNATGVAVALTAARQLVADGAPRRSIVVAFWDREEDGLLGSADFLAAPPIPTESIVAYLNWDIQGSNLLPSLVDTTIVVGAETGGDALVEATRRATDASDLEYAALSLIFGQGRSDHARFVAAGVPSVFFTDVTNGCYHTTGDDLDVVDFRRLDLQTATARALAAELVATDDLPTITSAPTASFADAEAMLAVSSAAVSDAGLLTSLPDGFVEQYLADLEAIVAAGEAAFDADATGVVLTGAAALVDALARTACDGYLAAAVG